MNTELAIDTRETRLTRRRYDCIAPNYDGLEWMMEWRARPSQLVPSQVREGCSRLAFSYAKDRELA